ncbi:MAG: filamentous hemagglutinin N-terminal domain-containing protein [Leptolyngbyaceae cyanobacterium]
MVQAQVVPDTILSTPSQVNQISDSNRQIRITGGTQSGSNLFHSFEEFSIPNRAIASFQNIDPAVERIFSRVTGSSRSRINGAIQTLQTNGTLSNADFFLINPNGIVFGQNASLNIGGSFLATTADSLQFADGSEFSAVSPQNSPLLTVSVPVGLQFGRNPAPIRNASTASLIRDNQDFPISGGLQVTSGETLALVGGKINLPGGILTAVSGRIELGSVGEESLVNLSLRNGATLDYSNVNTFRPIQLSAQAGVNTTGLDSAGGEIQIQGSAISLRDQSTVLSGTFGAENGQDLVIQGSSLLLDNASQISTNTFGTGKGGNIRVDVDQLTLRDSAQLFANVVGEGNGGNIRIGAHSIQLLGGQIREVISDDRDSPDNKDPGNQETTDETVEEAEFFTSSIRAVVFEHASGEGGDVRIRTNHLELADGGQIAADTRGSGDSGDIRIRANTIRISGIARSSDNQPFIRDNLTTPSSISAATFEKSEADGGDIFLNANTLTVLDGATIQFSTASAGNAGALNIDVTNSIELSGTIDNFFGGLFSFSGGLAGEEFDIGVGNEARESATGQGGEITVRARKLVVSDRSVIAVGSLNPNQEAAGSGSISIQAEQISLAEQGSLLSATASGDGGDINLIADSLLLLRGNSLIETTAGLEESGGRGGNITLDADFVVAELGENSDIRANAFDGDGGDINVTVFSLFGLQENPAQRNELRANVTNDISASSQFGNFGIITIEDLGVDPVQAIAQLPTDFESPPLTQGCQPGRTGQGEFVNIGRGGIPTSPDDPISGDRLWEDITPSTLTATTDAASTLTEAETWFVNDKGQIVLGSSTSLTSSRLLCQ